MPRSARISLFCLISLIAFGQTACNMVPQQALRQSQLRTLQLHRQNQAVAAQRNQANQLAQALDADKQSLQARRQNLESQLQTANRRLDNLKSERTQLQQQYVSLLNRSKSAKSPLNDDTTRRMQKLAQTYPGFEFDPHTGVSKFHSDILFASGSAVISKSGQPILREFAGIMNEGEARRLNILVVGHTDDRRIAKSATRRFPLRSIK